MKFHKPLKKKKSGQYILFFPVNGVKSIFSNVIGNMFGLINPLLSILFHDDSHEAISSLA